MLVGGQALLLAILVLVPSGHAWKVPSPLRTAGQVLRWVGLAAVVVGALRLGRAGSVHPEPSRRATLRTDGPYHVVRHPIYSAVLLFAAGIVVTAGSVAALLAFAALAGLLSLKARFEERLLVQRFAGYAQYARVTPRFVPGLRPAIGLRVAPGSPAPEPGPPRFPVRSIRQFRKENHRGIRQDRHP